MNKFVQFVLVLMTSVACVSAQCPTKCSCDNEDKTVACRDAGLTHLPEGAFSKKVTKLDLSNNRIPHLKDDVFIDHAIFTLEKLVVSNNGLTSIESDSLIGLSSLTYFDISNNDIADIQSKVFVNVQKLDVLFLNNNPFLVLPENGFDLPVLREIYLNGCGLRKIPKMFFENMANIETIILSNNELVSFDSNLLLSQTSLNRLDLNLNRLTNLPEVVYSLPKSLGLLNILNNTWHCGCELQSSYPVYSKKLYKQMLTCSSPKELKDTDITDDVIERLTEQCHTTTTTTTTTESETESTPTAELTESPEDDIEILNNTLLLKDKTSDAIKLSPRIEVSDNIAAANVGSGFEGFFYSNQWWVITVTALILLSVCIGVINYQVMRFRQRQTERRKKSHFEEEEMTEFV